MIDIETVASQLANTFGTGQTSPPLTRLYPSIDLPTAYRIADGVRARRLSRDYGPYALDPWPTLCGLTIMLMGRTWFIDRMVWLFDDTIHTSATYRSWLY